MGNDDINKIVPQQTPIQSGQNPAGVSPTGSLQKEQESLPSAAANFSELDMPAEKRAEPEPQVFEAAQTPIKSGQTQTQSPKSGHMQHLLTKQQAQQIVKGPLMFKNSGDPLLWLAFLLLRHYQLLEKEEEEK